MRRRNAEGGAAAAAVTAVVMLAGLLAGCLGASPPTGAPGNALATPPLPLDIPLVDIGHDHEDPALHPERAMGLHRVATLPLAEQGQAGRMVRAGDLLLVALVGAVPGRAGFAVVDVAEPAAPRLLGTYASGYGASEGEALAVTPDGGHAFVGIETGYSAPGTLPMVEVVSLADPAAPVLRQRVPAATQPHVLTFFEAAGAGYLVTSDYQLTISAAGALPASSAVSAGVTLYRFDASAGTLEPAARHAFDPTEATPGTWFAHDPVVVDHPVTGERVLYLAAFGGGGRILSVEDPTRPREVGFTKEQGDAPVLRHHSFVPGPRLVGEVLPTAAVPRSRAADGQAHLFLYDSAVPSAPRLLGTWHHPDPDLLPGDEPPLNLHVPVFTEDGTRLLVPHFHAGLFVFDVSTEGALAAPEPVAYWAPGGSGGDGPMAVAMALEVGEHVLASEASSRSLVALAWGDAPAP